MSHQSVIDQRETILTYPVDIIDRDEALRKIEAAWAAHTSMHVVTLNAEMIIAAQKDSRLDTIIRQANLVIADGAGIVLALKLYGRTINRLPGIELAQIMLAHAAAKNISVALIGSTTKVLDNLIRTLPQTYPGLNLTVCNDGYFQATQENSIIKTINKSGAGLVLVAMGVPRQEYFIELARQTSQAVFIGVGGSFDVWAGTKRRAPEIYRQCHLEWLYRLHSEPSRFKRMSEALPQFACQAIAEFLRNKSHD